MLTVRHSKDTLLEAGVDEAGRGCLWGPLYAAAVLWPPEEEWLDEHREIAPQIKDSKKLTPKKRAMLADAIKALAMDYGIGVVSPQEIDSLGMSAANRLAFTRALDQLSITPDRLLIDGCLPLYSEDLTTRGIQVQHTIVEGDGTYLPIAAASIVAKEARDSYVAEYIKKESSLESNYSIGSSKGYGTEKHRKGILTHGKHSEHRNLFLRKRLGENTSSESDCLITDT